MAEGPSPFEMRIDELMDEGLSWEEAYEYCFTRILQSRRTRRIFQSRRHSEYCLMAKITQALTRAGKDYDQKTQQSLVRDLDAVINKLNTSFQEEVKQEIEARSFFLE